MNPFFINEKNHKLNLSFGTYRIYLLGGFSIENIDLLDVKLSKISSGENVEIRELNFKTTDYVSGKKAVACFEFEIVDNDEYQIDFKGYENLAVKESRLFLKNLLFPSKKSGEEIEVIIK